MGEGSHTVAFLLHSDFLNPSVLIKELLYPPPTGICTEKGNTLKQMLWSEKRAVSCFSKKKKEKKKKFSEYKYGSAWFGLFSFGMVLYCFVSMGPYQRYPWERETEREQEREREREWERERDTVALVLWYLDDLSTIASLGNHQEGKKSPCPGLRKEASWSNIKVGSRICIEGNHPLIPLQTNVRPRAHTIHRAPSQGAHGQCSLCSTSRRRLGVQETLKVYRFPKTIKLLSRLS